MTVMSSSDLFASSFTVLFSFGKIINCRQHTAFTAFLREEEGPHFGVRRGFYWTFWYDTDNKRHPDIFANWTMNFREFSRIELNSLPLSLCSLLSTCSIPPQSLDTGKWVHCSKEMSTSVYITQHTLNRT